MIIKPFKKIFFYSIFSIKFIYIIKNMHSIIINKQII